MYSKKMKTSLKTGFAQISPPAQKNLSYPKFWGRLQPPSPPPPPPPGPYAYVCRPIRSVIMLVINKLDSC